MSVLFNNSVPIFPISPYPIQVRISITNICQQLCCFCNIDHQTARNNKKFMSLETIKKMDWLQHVKEIWLYGTGEVLVHPQYTEIIKEVREKAPHALITVYTNGLALNGKRLAVTLQCANIIHISQNAVNEQTYNTIIKNGSYTKAMKNLEVLAKLRPSYMQVNLSMIIMNETLSDITDFIDLVSKYNFNKLILSSYQEPPIRFSYTPPETSQCDINTVCDTNKILQYAKSKNVNVTIASCLTSGENICVRPYTLLMIYLDEFGKIRINYCCNGLAGITVSEDALSDIEKLWNNSRIKHIRETVNDRFRLIENKLCLSCRIVNKYWKLEKMNAAMRSIGVKFVNHLPTFFKNMYIPLYLLCTVSYIYI